MNKLHITNSTLATYKDIIRFDVERRYKNVEVEEKEKRQAKIRIVAFFIHGSKHLSELYNKLGYSKSDMLFTRIDLIEEYLQRATKKKDLSYRRIIDKLYKESIFWDFLIGLWIERDIEFHFKLHKMVCFDTGKTKLVYIENIDTGMVELDTLEDLQFFYEGYHRRKLRKAGYECIKFIEGYINQRKNESSKMDSTIQGTDKKHKSKNNKKDKE